ncbi:MAG: hypothetical protein ABL961_04485 [Vicinamibacterales bacterium]
MSVAPMSLVGIDESPSSTPSEDGDRQLIRRVQAEYREMPGLCLTLDQACRLWALDRDTCSRVLEALVAEEFVAVAERGIYVRRTTA